MPSTSTASRAGLCRSLSLSLLLISKAKLNPKLTLYLFFGFVRVLCLSPPTLYLTILLVSQNRAQQTHKMS